MNETMAMPKTAMGKTKLIKIKEMKLAFKNAPNQLLL